MKEYLTKNSSGNYQLVNHRFSEGDIEVPDGAEVATASGLAIYFWKPSENKAFINNVGWYVCDTKTICTLDSYLGDVDVSIIWQRHTQPEELPFMDSLNDQYAEIEQVRQSGMKFDSNKPRHSLLPKGAINSVIEVLEFGAKKYSADNWQEVDNAKERYYNAAMRHIDLWWNGEKLDPETNVHHLAHAATNLFFLMWFDNK